MVVDTPTTREKHAPLNLFPTSANNEVAALKEQIKLLQGQLEGQASMFVWISIFNIHLACSQKPIP